MLRVMAVTCLLASVASAEDAFQKRLDDSPRHQEWVELKNGERAVKAFVVYPEKKDKAPVVVLIHEIMGLTTWVMSTADRLAEAGYIAIAPDFLSGMGPNGGRSDSFADATKAREAMGALKPDQVTGDLDAAVDYGKKIESADGKVAVAGFCWGGKETFRFATHRADIAGAFVFYGAAPTDVEAMKKIKVAVHGFYGGEDNRVNAGLPDTEKNMKAAERTFEPVIYEGAGHGFMRAGEMPDATEANKKAREAGWKRWLELLGKMK
jgi:carboxymethylenebutenolidase